MVPLLSVMVCLLLIEKKKKRREEIYNFMRQTRQTDPLEHEEIYF
jgi:hypothetical protein